MHPEAYSWVAHHATVETVAVLDIGGRDINGSTRDLFPNSEWVVLDYLPGDNVDVEADAAAELRRREALIDLRPGLACVGGLEHAAFAEAGLDADGIVGTVLKALRHNSAGVVEGARA